MSETKGEAELIKAAGGLVWLSIEGEKRIVIVHREKHGGGWTLPKGKLEKDEEWVDAARREVKEETGIPEEYLNIDGIAGTISYMADGKPKIVVFYNMSCSKSDPFKNKPDKEVDKVISTSVSEALGLLRYPHEQYLLRDSCTLADRKPALFSNLKKMFKSSSHRRLDTAIGPFELEVRNQITRIESMDIEDSEKEKMRQSASICLQMIECAKKALDRSKIELGWRYFFEAELTCLYLLKNSPSELKTKALATLIESEDKLSSWRKKTVQNLLGKDGNLKAEYETKDVYAAKKILQEHHTNTYIKLKTAQFQLQILAAISILPIIALLFLLPNLSGQTSFTNVPLLLSVVFVGMMGGCFSGIFSISRNSNKGRIPAQLLDSWLTIARPIIGAIAALALSLFLLSGIVNVGELTQYLILAMSFAVGFSERLLIQTINSKQS